MFDKLRFGIARRQTLSSKRLLHEVFCRMMQNVDIIKIIKRNLVFFFQIHPPTDPFVFVFFFVHDKYAAKTNLTNLIFLQK